MRDKKFQGIKSELENECHIWHNTLMEVLTTEDFDSWYQGLTLKDRGQIDARIARIEKFEHFGDFKYLGDGVAELRWRSGRRIYFAKVGDKIILLLNGGLKNAQQKDIKKAKRILKRYAEDET